MEAFNKVNSPTKRKLTSPTKPAIKRSRNPVFAMSKGVPYEVTSSKVVDSYDYVLQPTEIHNRIKSSHMFNLDLFYKIVNLVKNARSSLTSLIKSTTSRLRALDDLVENKTDEFHEYLHKCAAIYASAYDSNSSANPKQHMIHEQEFFVHCLNTKIACLITSVDSDAYCESSHQTDVNDSVLTSSSNSDTETNVTNTSVGLVNDFQCLMPESLSFTTCDTLNSNIVENEFDDAKCSIKKSYPRNKLNCEIKVGLTPVTSCEFTLSDISDTDANFYSCSLSIPDTADLFPFDWTDPITV